MVVECSGADDAIAVVNEGVKNRKVGSHNLNSESSRSHRYEKNIQGGKKNKIFKLQSHNLKKKKALAYSTRKMY